MNKTTPLLSLVVPVYNEAAGIRQFNEALQRGLDHTFRDKYEIIYVDDGSIDGTITKLSAIATSSPQVRLLRLTRNFGKEIATTAGIHAAEGQAILMLDADGQHPMKLIPEFVAQWQAGAKVVVGRRSNRNASWTKRVGSKLFYGIFAKATGLKLDSNRTDFRLIDRSVQVEFNHMTERNRITRGLIDWLGHDQATVEYEEAVRKHGEARYSLRKLTKLAIDSAVSLSISPLYFSAYAGAIVLPVSMLIGFGMLGNFLLQDPLHLHATASSYGLVFLLFLVGILLVSQGIIGIYLSRIHAETQGRPLYIIDKAHSKGVTSEY